MWIHRRPCPHTVWAPRSVYHTSRGFVVFEFSLCRSTRTLRYSYQRLSTSMLFQLLLCFHIFHWTYGAFTCRIWTYPTALAFASYNRCLWFRAYGFACRLFTDIAASAAALFGPRLLLLGSPIAARSSPFAGCSQ